MHPVAPTGKCPQGCAYEPQRVDHEQDCPTPGIRPVRRHDAGVDGRPDRHRRQRRLGGERQSVETVIEPLCSWQARIRSPAECPSPDVQDKRRHDDGNQPGKMFRRHRKNSTVASHIHDRGVPLLGFTLIVAGVCEESVMKARGSRANAPTDLDATHQAFWVTRPDRVGSITSLTLRRPHKVDPFIVLETRGAARSE